MSLERRKRDIILRIVDQYISSAHPIGSLYLVEKYQLNVSSATIRNIMALLEEEGFVYQPHSSAGRIPTEQAYQYYAQSLKSANLSPRSEERLRVALEEAETLEVLLRRLVKEIAGLSEEIAFGSLGADLFSSGMSNLCTKPEFEDRDLMAHLSVLLDRLDELVAEVEPHVSDDPEIWIGKDNRFSSECSTIIMKYHIGSRTGILGILGPMRMNYGKNVAIMKSIKSLLELDT
jgi:heat-inducible transcriptional repressor